MKIRLCNVIILNNSEKVKGFPVSVNKFFIITSCFTKPIRKGILRRISLLLFNLTRFNNKTFFIFIFTPLPLCLCTQLLSTHFPSLLSPLTNTHYPAANFTSIRKAASYLINALRRKLFLKSWFKFVSPPLLVWVFCKWCKP